LRKQGQFLFAGEFLAGATGEMTMNRVILSGSAALALAFTASPALAQAAIGGIAGDINIDHMTISNSDKLNVSIDNTLTASSGSGFGGTFTVNPNFAAGTNAATFSGSGTAFSIAGDLSVNLGGYDHDKNSGWGGNLGTDIAGSYSSSSGSFTATTLNAASITGQVMNFGQSEFTRSFTADYSAKNSFDLNNWNAGGFVVGGFAEF
jgi:hypothetical protein